MYINSKKCYIKQIYEERDDVDGFIQNLYDGKVDLMADEKFNSLMDTFDTLLKYNTWGDVQCSNELGQYVKQYADEGKMVPGYNYDPDDQYSKVDAIMQKYLSGEIDREELAKEVQDYRANVTPVEN